MITNQRHTMSANARICTVILLVVGLTGLVGAVYGRLTQRWGPTADLTAAARRLADFPQKIGTWELVNEQPIAEDVVEMLSCGGYVNRQYVDRATGHIISVAILLGPPGPIAVHTPEVCYSSRAYTLQKPRNELSLTDEQGRGHSFWSTKFSSSTPSVDELEVCYAWSDDGDWKASRSPRFEFAARPFLVKIQLAALSPATSPTQSKQTPSVCQEFLSAMLRSGWSLNG